MNENDNLKKKILNELSDESVADGVLKDILQEEPANILGDDFTASVMRTVKATKKASPIIRLTRVALPFAACAAAVVIFISVGAKNTDTSFLPNDMNVVKVEGDMSIATDPITPTDEDFDLIPPSDQSQDTELPDTLPLEESEGDEEIKASNSSSAATVQGDPQANAPDSEKLYGYNLAKSQEVITFTPTVDSENTVAEIRVRVSASYYGKTIFGREVYLSTEGEEYEVILISEKRLTKSELLDQISTYGANLCAMMNKSTNTKDWQIEIISESLPATIEPNSRIKIERTE